MKKILLTLIFTLGFASLASAQVATQNNKLGWTQVGQTAVVANGFTYNYYIDASTTATLATGVLCVTGTPIANSDCSANFPALTLGMHTIQMTQASGVAESLKSTSFSFTFVVLITPTGIKIVGLQIVPNNPS